MTQATLKFTGVTKNPVKRKASPAQLAARQKFADMVRARAAAAKGKKMPRKNPIIQTHKGFKIGDSVVVNSKFFGLQWGKIVKLDKQFAHVKRMGKKFAEKYPYDAVELEFKKNPTDFFIEKFHLGGKMYAQIIEKSDHTFDMYIYQMQSTGIKGEGNYEQFFDSKNYKTKSGAMRGLEKWAKQHQYSVTPKLQSNPRKKTVSQKISQLEHEGYPHKQSIAIALSEQRRGKVKRNPSGEIGAYEITRNFKVLGIFKTKADAIKAAQGISDATGKTIAVKPVQVLAGHFDR